MHIQLELPRRHVKITGLCLENASKEAPSDGGFDLSQLNIDLPDAASSVNSRRRGRPFDRLRAGPAVHRSSIAALDGIFIAWGVRKVMSV
jgi:hypothetical protein